MTVGYYRNFLRKMSSLAKVNLVPIGVRGMKVLNRDKFLRNLSVPVLKVKEEDLLQITQICKPYFLKLKAFKPVQSLETEAKNVFNKCIYLNPENIIKFADIKDSDCQALSKLNVTEDNFDIREIELSYENWSFDTIFKAVLPENEEIVSSFSQIGHIIHLNLRCHLLEYRSLIGQVLVDKIKTCRTVVNKSNIIDNTFRNFSMEVIAGDEDYFVTVKENRCIFQFDFSKVYWNPRLCKEHERILSYLKPEDVLFDVFCGVGPFSVPAAKRKIKVFANDLNPDSFKWLNHNSKYNKINPLFFQSFNQDGKHFICNTFKDYLVNLCKHKEKLEGKIHITMNLPAMAVEFLKHFNGLLKHEEFMENFNYEIIVYVYCFAIGDNPVDVAKKMVTENIGRDISSDILDVFDVRNVSPKKEMMRVTFKLTKDVLWDIMEDFVEPPSKRICTDVSRPVVAVSLSNMVQTDVADVLRETEEVIRQCFTQYEIDEVFLSFNGGKDCTVLLDITINVLKQMYRRDDIANQLKVVYIKTGDSFKAIETFVDEIKEHYGLNMMVAKGTLKATLEQLLKNDRRIKACLMGTRRTDPYSENLQFMQCTDSGWPEVMRVSPLLNWSYHQIWSYIRQKNVPYCVLYDNGYTSIGSVHNTQPNPKLAYVDPCGRTAYLPAWQLKDGSLERAGRGIVSETINGHNGHITEQD